MAEQGHYGSAGKGVALVPGALTVYRHFYIDARIGRLTPIGYKPSRVPVGEGTARGPYPEKHPWGAVCSPPLTLRFYGTDRELEPEPEPDHPAPHVDCTCGFYAHYDPSTDFYPTLKWGRAYQTSMGFAYDAGGFQNLILVRAVCEVSGTVVMGSLGVRAQKMTIKAMAVDWDKHHGEYLVDEDTHWASMYSASLYGRLVRQPYADPSEEETAWAASVADGLGGDLGIPVYDTAEEMYAAHPKSDVSALGVEEKTEAQIEQERRDRWAESMKFIRAAEVKDALKQAGATFRQVTASLSTVGYTPSISWRDDVVDDLYDVEFTFGDTSAKAKYEKTLKAKKNRPAPPGTGIDRRRGRLR